MTIAELQAGVLAAADVDTRARRRAKAATIADIEVLAAHDLPIVTQDDDLRPVDGVGGLTVIRV